VQLIGTKGITLFVAVVVTACAVGFGSGLLVGRHFPTRSFQKFGDTRYVLDPTTGKVCDPFKDPNANPADLSDLFPPAPATSGSQTAKDATDPFAAYGGHEIKPASHYPPACGK
jgi:hypothetical protein